MSKRYKNSKIAGQENECVLFERNYYERASLVRAFQYIADNDRGGIFCSAFRLNESDDANRSNHSRLGEFLTRRKIGRWEALGRYEECDEKGGVMEVKAVRSCIIPRDPNISEERFLDLAREILEIKDDFSQQEHRLLNEVLFRFPGETGIASIAAPGTRRLDLEFHPDEVAGYFMKLLGRHYSPGKRNFHFVFLGVLIAGDMSQARAMDRDGIYGRSVNSQFGVDKLSGLRVEEFLWE